MIVTRRPRSLSRPCDLGLDLSREIDFGEPHVSVLVALDVLQPGELGRIELVDETLGQHRDAEVAPHRPPLDDRAFDDVADAWQTARSATAHSSATRVSVAPAALPMPSARWPALRPIATTTYQRRVDLRVFHQVSDQLDSDVPGGLEAERGHVRRQRQVVVDRLRHVDAADGAGRVFG